MIGKINMLLNPEDINLGELEGDKWFHYTNFQVLKSILETKEIWFNNILYSNDSLELKYFYNVLVNYILKKYDLPDSNVKRFFYDNLLKKKVSAVLDDIEKYSYFVFCLSNKNDDASQWFQYGDCGTGISMEIDLKELFCSMPEHLLNIQKVIYDEKRIIKKLDNIFKNDSAKEILYLSERQTIEIFKALSALAIKCKHKTFASECEGRVYINGKRVLEDKLLCQNVKTDIFNNDIKQRYILKIPYDKLEDIIKCITIGPKSKVSKIILQDYLNERNYKKLANNVQVSESSMR